MEKLHKIRSRRRNRAAFHTAPPKIKTNETKKIFADLEKNLEKDGKNVKENRPTYLTTGNPIHYNMHRRLVIANKQTDFLLL